MYPQLSEHNEEPVMPDGDIYHQGLSPSYQRTYRQVCEGQIRSDLLAYSLSLHVRKDLERLHHDAASAIDRVVRRLEYLVDSMGSRSVDWRQESMRLREEVRGCGSRRNCDQIVVVAQEVLVGLSNQHIPDNMGEAVGQKIADRVYKAKFGDVVLTPPDGISAPPPNEMQGRISEIESHLNPILSNLGTQLSQFKDGQRAQLRMPARQNKVTKIDDLDADISVVLN